MKINTTRRYECTRMYAVCICAMCAAFKRENIIVVPVVKR